MSERLRGGIYRLGRGAVNTSHKGEPYYEGCGIYALQALGEKVDFIVKTENNTLKKIIFLCIVRRYH